MLQSRLPRLSWKRSTFYRDVAVLAQAGSIKCTHLYVDQKPKRNFLSITPCGHTLLSKQSSWWQTQGMQGLRRQLRSYYAVRQLYILYYQSITNPVNRLYK